MLKTKTFWLMLIVAVSQSCFAGYLVTNATIKSVTNTNNNTESFAIIFADGQGICLGSGVTFPIAAAGSSKVYDRGFSVALTALSTGMKVDIYNYQDNDCNKASYIEIKR